MLKVKALRSFMYGARGMVKRGDVIDVTPVEADRLCRDYEEVRVRSFSGRTPGVERRPRDPYCRLVKQSGSNMERKGGPVEEDAGHGAPSQPEHETDAEAEAPAEIEPVKRKRGRPRKVPAQQ